MTRRFLAYGLLWLVLVYLSARVSTTVYAQNVLRAMVTTGAGVQVPLLVTSTGALAIGN